MLSLFGWRRRRSAPLSRRRRRTNLAVEALEDRCQPATLVAPDLLTQWDTGHSGHDNLTFADQPVFAGTTTSPIGTTISLFIDGAPVGSTTITRAGGGPFTLQPSTPIAEGEHVAQFFDSKSQSVSNALAFTADFTPPNVPPAPALVSAADPANIEFQVEGETGDFLFLTIDGQDVAAVLAAGGPQSLAVDFAAWGIDSTLPYTVTVTAADSAGNFSAESEAFAYSPGPTVDMAPPVISNAEILPNALSPNFDDVQEEAAFRFELSEPADVTVEYFDGFGELLGAVPLGQLAVGPHELQLTAPGFPEDTYTLSITATDLASNVSEPVSISFVVDLTPPEPPMFDLAAGQDTGVSPSDGITTLSTLTLSGIAEPGTIVDIAEGDVWLTGTVAATDGSWSATVSLTEGSHTLAAYGTDAAGNSSSSWPVVVVVDTQSPDVDLGADRSAARGAPITLTALVTDASPVTGLWELISTDNGSTVAPANSASFTFTPSLPGVYVFRHTATDAVGQSGEATVTVTVLPNQVPTIAAAAGFTMLGNTTLVVSAPGLVASFSDADGDGVAIQLVTGPGVGTFSVNPDGAFRYTPPIGFTGTVTFTICAFDGYELSSPLDVTIVVTNPYVLRRSR